MCSPNASQHVGPCEPALEKVCQGTSGTRPCGEFYFIAQKLLLSLMIVSGDCHAAIEQPYALLLAINSCCF